LNQITVDDKRERTEHVLSMNDTHNPDIVYE